jgi:hypothetical protein
VLRTSLEPEALDATATVRAYKQLAQVERAFRSLKTVAAAPFPRRRFLASAGLGGPDRVVVEENTAIPKIAAVYARAPLDTLKASRCDGRR